MFRLCSTEGIKVLSKLAPRETQLILLACGGLTDKEIARSLSISLGTVITLWSTIRGKLGINSRAAAVSAMAWAVAKLEGRTVPELDETDYPAEAAVPQPATAVLWRHQIVLICNPLAATMFETRPGLTLDKSPILTDSSVSLPWARTEEREVMTDDIVQIAYPPGRIRQFLVNCTFLNDPVFGKVAVVRILPADEHSKPARVSNEAVVYDRESQPRSRLSEEATQLAEILDGILDDFEIQDQPRPLARVNLNRLLANVAAEVRLSAADARTEIRLDMSPATIQTDAEILTVCFRNLIAHTVRLSSESDWPRVLILGKKSGDRYQLTIRESGVELDPANPNRVVQMFEPRTGATSGFSLTLAVWAATRLGGSITFDSRSERPTFALDLPLTLAQVGDSSNVA